MWKCIKNHKRFFAGVTIIVALVTALTIVLPNSVQITKSPTSHKTIVTIGYSTVSATGSTDYAFTGSSDNTVVNTAISALLAQSPTGGEILITAPATGYSTINFSATVNVPANVMICGSGYGTYVVDNGTTPLFTVTGNGASFYSLRVDAGGISTGSYTYTFNDVMMGTTVYNSSSPYVTAPTGRGVTEVVAASNATTPEKAQADFVCTGTNDQVIIAEAQTLAGTNGGKVCLSSGTFNLTSLTISNVTIEGEGAVIVPLGSGQALPSSANSTIINTTGGITITEGGRLQGVTVQTNGSFSGTAVQVGVNSTGYVSDVNYVLDDVTIIGASYTQGIGLCLNYVELCTFGSLQIAGYAVGIKLYAPSAPSFVTSNTFVSTYCYGCQQSLLLDNVYGSGQGVAGNIFSSFVIQPISGQTTNGGISLVDATNNIFPALFIWDWNSTLLGTAITFDSNSTNNQISGYIPVAPTGSNQTLSVSDSGWGNEINSSVNDQNHIYTVKAHGGDFTTLSAALTQVSSFYDSTPSATNQYTILVYGDITDSGQPNPIPYINVVGFNANITLTYAGSPFTISSATNFTWSNLSFTATVMANYGQMLIQSGGAGTFNNCTFTIASSVSSSYAVNNIAPSGGTTVFNNCTFTNANSNSSSANVEFASGSALTLNNCLFIQTGSAGYNAYIAAGSKGILNHCEALTLSNTSGNEAWTFSGVSGTTTDGCTGIDSYAYTANTTAPFNTGGLTGNATIWTQPANTVLTSVSMSIGTAFSGGSSSSFIATVGTGASNYLIGSASAFQLHGTAGGTSYRTKGANGWTNGESYSSAGQAYGIYLTTVGANISTVTAGTLTVIFAYRLVQ